MKSIKTRIYIGFALICGSALSCTDFKVNAPKFNVSIDKTTFSIGDTLRFKIEGSTDNILFYSGEIGNNYDTRNTYTATGGKPVVNFSTALTAATNSSAATNLKLLVSTDFNGNYTKSDILAASWIDLTSRVNIPGANQSLDLSSYKVEGKPLFVAFRFQTVDNTKVQRLITVSNFSFNTTYSDQTYSNATNVYNAGFGAFDFAGNTGKWTIPVVAVNNNSFTHNQVPADSPIDDDWAISAPFNINSILPSRGVSLKATKDDSLKEYSYIFEKTGTYKVVFVGSNTSNSDYKEVVKQFMVTIE